MSSQMVMCAKCERVFKIEQGIFLHEKYTCDRCRMREQNPRALQPDQIEVIQPWDTVEDQFCPECGEHLWVFGHKLHVAREMTTEAGIVIIGAAGEPLWLFECANPHCSRSWEGVSAKQAIPSFMRPPWAKPQKGLFPRYDSLSPEEQDQADLIYHQLWWEQFQRQQRVARDAGKGVDLLKQTNNKE